MLKLPVCASTTIVLARPHYPDNVGATARALKTMGITSLCLVKPGRLAMPDHERAFKMAVRSWDVLESALVVDDLASALQPFDYVFATTGRAGMKGVITPRDAAARAVELCRGGARIAVVLGNEKTGLSREELAFSHAVIRIPMAAPQPSINLAQATQIIAYEWFVAGLGARGDVPSDP